MMHSFLLIGQSNAAGRGHICKAGPLDNDKLFVLRNGRWRKMYRPVNCDREGSGVCFAESFAELYAKEKGVEVGIIPCADGGSSLDQWVEGGLLFDHACYQAELASRTSTIAGILWHQGESETVDELFPFVEEKLTKIIEAFRRRLNLYDVPFLIGGLGDFLEIAPDWENFYKYSKYFKQINAIFEKLAENDKMIGYVSAKGLGCNEDLNHFSTAALIEFGERYFEKQLELEDKNKIFVEKSTQDAAIKNKLEIF